LRSFFIAIQGLEIFLEVYREERQSFKLELILNGNLKYCTIQQQQS
jgi:hypothetical protein